MLYKPFLVRYRLRCKTYGWTTLGVSAGKMLRLSGAKQDREIRLMIALAKVDFVKVYALINDLLW